MGIYKITNKINGKSYIGQSIDILQRWSQHKRSKDFNNPLYLDMEKYGQQNFIYEIIEECPQTQLNEREKFWIKYYNSYKDGYNRTCGGTGMQPIICHINKRIEEDESTIMVKWEDYTAAARNLSPSALNLYMYLAKNQDNYELWFSSKDYCQTFNVVDKTYRNARNELLRKGYLKEGENNHVYFDAAGGYAETKESLSQELKRIGSQLQEKDIDRYNKLYDSLAKANLRKVENETIYIIEIKKLISFGKDLLREVSESEIDGLL